MLIPNHLNRREMLRVSGFGFGSLALTYLLNQESVRADDKTGRVPQDLKNRPSHFSAQARAMVHFMQNGGPSQMDLFDPKQELQKRDGKPTPQSVETYQKGNTEKLLGSPFKVDGAPTSRGMHAPALGEHAEELLREPARR